MRLVDSHCHLNYDGLAERQDEVLDAARARGVSAFLNISTRQSEWGDVIGVAERNADVWASVGVHPHEADAHPDLGAAALVEARSASAGDRDRRVRARLLLRQVRPRRAARALPGAYRGGARRPACRWSSTPAMRRRIPPRSCERAAGEGGVTGVLHCFTGSAELARKALDLGFFVSMSGIVTFKNAQGSAGNRQGASRSTGCWSRPTRRSSPRSPTAARPASRPSSPTPPPSSPSFAARSPKRSLTPRRRISTGCSAGRRRETADPGLRHLGRRAPDRQRLGRLRPR